MKTIEERLRLLRENPLSGLAISEKRTREHLAKYPRTARWAKFVYTVMSPSVVAPGETTLVSVLCALCDNVFDFHYVSAKVAPGAFHVERVLRESQEQARENGRVWVDNWHFGDVISVVVTNTLPNASQCSIAVYGYVLDAQHENTPEGLVWYRDAPPLPTGIEAWAFTGPPITIEEK